MFATFDTNANTNWKYTTFGSSDKYIFATNKKNLVTIYTKNPFTGKYTLIQNPHDNDPTQTFTTNNGTESNLDNRFNQFSNELSELNQSFQTFSSDLTQNNLLDLRKKWLDAYIAWQYVEMFNIGKAEEIYYFQKTNIYPTNTARIELNVESATYDLENNSNNFSAQGFPAIDYMLYGIESDSNLVINKYQSIDGYKYTNYLSSLINQMISNTLTDFHSYFC